MNNRFIGGIFLFCDVLTKLVYLNVLWSLFTLVGGIVAGIAPATYVLFLMIKECIFEGKSLPIFKTYLFSYKKHFIQSQKTLLPLFLLIGVAGVNIFLTQVLVIPFENILFGIFIFLLIQFIIIGFFYIPIVVFYNTSIRESIKSAFLIGYCKWWHGIYGIFGCFVMLILLGFNPAMIPLVSISSLAAWIVFVSNKVFVNFGVSRTQA